MHNQDQVYGVIEHVHTHLVIIKTICHLRVKLTGVINFHHIYYTGAHNGTRESACSSYTPLRMLN